MQQVFKNAIFHVEPTVLKRRLLPLCCGHIFMLMAFENPFVTDSKKKRTLFDLALAVGICTRTFEDGKAWLTTETLIEDVKAWGKTCRKLNFPDEAVIFENYLQTYSQFPERWPSKERGSCQHPWPVVVATSIMDKVGESRAWNMPLSEAITIYSTMAEINGDTTLRTDWEIEAFKKLRAEAEKAKGKANEKNN